MNEDEEERSAFELEHSDSEPEPSPAAKRRLSDAVEGKPELTDEEKSNELIRQLLAEEQKQSTY